MLLTGSNDLVHTLRLLTAIELFLNKKYYAEHPLLKSIFINSKDSKGAPLFRFYNSVFYMACTGSDNDVRKLMPDIVSQDAIRICADKVWSPFLCLLGLSTVLKGNSCNVSRFRGFKI